MVNAFLIGLWVGLILNMAIFLFVGRKEKKAEKNVANRYKWWKTTCCYCGRLIEVKMPVDRVRKNRRMLDSNACFHCIPKDSVLRNGMDESGWETLEL